MNAPLQNCLRNHRLESQLQLVGEHWSSVRRLWLGTSHTPADFLGVLPADFWTGCGMPGLANIKVTRDGLFEFVEEGARAVVLPAYDTIPGLVVASSARHVEHLIDLIAVDIDQHDRFWRRRGDSLVLGNAYLEIAGQEDEPLPVFRNPLTWFRDMGGGIVVLDWDWARELLTGLDLVAEDLALGERLEAALKPDIWVMEAACPSAPKTLEIQ